MELVHADARPELRRSGDHDRRASAASSLPSSPSSRRTWSPVTAPIYALLEGLVLGGLSAVFELRYPGIAMEAVAPHVRHALRAAACLQVGLIKVTQKFRLGVVAATGGILLFYMLQMLLSFFHISFFTRLRLRHSSASASASSWSPSPRSTSCSTSTLSSRASAYGAPKYMEWYAAFGIMVTLVWLYLEILRLLSKVRSRQSLLLTFPRAALGANFSQFEERGATNMEYLRATSDDEMGKIGPSPPGCGANRAILRCHPRLWTRHSLRIPPRLARFSFATPPARKLITGSRRLRFPEAKSAEKPHSQQCCACAECRGLRWGRTSRSKLP